MTLDFPASHSAILRQPSKQTSTALQAHSSARTYPMGCSFRTLLFVVQHQLGIHGLLLSLSAPLPSNTSIDIRVYKKKSLTRASTRCSEPTCKAISRRLTFIYWEDTTGKQLAVTTQERLGLRAPTSVILAGKENPFLLKSRLPCDWEKLMG